MKNGDISNELPRRFLVHVDVISKTTPEIKKKFKVIPTVVNHMELDSISLSRLYIYTTKVGTTLELISTSHSQDELDKIIDTLDKAGTNPFRYHTVYDDVQHVVKSLPYHPEVMGVLDIPSRVLMYGHWGVTFRDLFGG